MSYNQNSVFIVINKILGSQWVPDRESGLHFRSVSNRTNDKKLRRIKVLEILKPCQRKDEFYKIYSLKYYQHYL